MNDRTEVAVWSALRQLYAASYLTESNLAYSMCHGHLERHRGKEGYADILTAPINDQPPLSQQVSQGENTVKMLRVQM